jgi:hypothetical protein
VTVPPADPRAAQRVTLRRAVLQLVLGVMVLDAVALGAFYLTGIAHGPSRPRTIFVAAWTIATAITVAVLLRRVRAIRFGRRPR